MSSSNLSLVTGATGHVGFNLVSHLLEQGETVRAGARDLAKARTVLAGLDVETVRAELLDQASLDEAMTGVDTLYAVAASFRGWARDPEREIVQVNVEGARNVMRAAARAGARRIVYVSSMTTLDSSVQPFSAETWNPLHVNPYESSKTDAEQLVLRFAVEHQLDISTILPGAIVGPGYARPTDSTALFGAILSGQLPIDPDLYLLVVDARDVAAACYLAAAKGVNGARYIVCNPTPISTGQIVKIAQQVAPQRAIRTPRKLPKPVLLAIARASVLASRILHRPPLMRPDIVKLYGNAPHLRADTSRTERELGLHVIPSEQTIRDTIAYELSREHEPAPTAVAAGTR
jgi:dihydroflavonol-4-reductase